VVGFFSNLSYFHFVDFKISKLEGYVIVVPPPKPIRTCCDC